MRRRRQLVAVAALGCWVPEGIGTMRIVCASFEQRNCISIDVSGDRSGGPVSRGFRSAI